jgi:site-specific DNA-adenine methylase
MSLIGCKNNKDLFINLLGKLIPNNIELYVEPFGGEFGLYQLLDPKPNFAIYNDINPDLFNIINHKYLKDNSVFCYNKDYKEIIKKYDGENTFFSCDPPYYQKTYYKYNFLKKENHIELANILKNIKGKFLLSYQDKPLMRELYCDYNFYKYSGTNFILKPEIAITNY